MLVVCAALSLTANSAAVVQGKAQQRAKKGKQSKHKGPPPDLDFEPAGWEGGSYGEQKSGKKKGKPKAAIPQYNTAEELYTALAEIISHVPPTSRGSSTTLASLGDKLQTLTKVAWNKRYKQEFGSMAKFLQANPAFIVNGDEVGLNEAAAKKKAGKKAKDAARASSGRQESDESEEESESESEGDDAAQSASPRRSPQQKQKQRTQADSSEGGGITVKSILLTVAAAAIASYLWLDHIRPMMQKK